MTERNYDTTLEKPFIRGQEILIKYGVSEEDRVKLSITEVEAIVDSEGKIHTIQGFSNNIDKVISLAELNSENFELINPITGENIGQQMSLQNLFVAIVSYIRKIQKESYPENN